jgi:hypothetical protein
LIKEFNVKQKKDKKIKKDYEKPQLRIIELSADEVLATGCKKSFGDPAGVSGTGCQPGSPCVAVIGS